MSFQEYKPIQMGSYKQEEIPVSLEQKIRIGERMQEIADRAEKKVLSGQWQLELGDSKEAFSFRKAIFYTQELKDTMPHREFADLMLTVQSEFGKAPSEERVDEYNGLMLREVRRQVTRQEVGLIPESDCPFGRLEDTVEKLQTVNPETIAEEIRRQGKMKRIARTILRPFRGLQKGQ